MNFDHDILQTNDPINLIFLCTHTKSTMGTKYSLDLQGQGQGANAFK